MRNKIINKIASGERVINNSFGDSNTNFGFELNYQQIYQDTIRKVERFGFHAGHSQNFNQLRNKKI